MSTWLFATRIQWSRASLVFTRLFSTANVTRWPKRFTSVSWTTCSRRPRRLTCVTIWKAQHGVARRSAIRQASRPTGQWLSKTLISWARKRCSKLGMSTGKASCRFYDKMLSSLRKIISSTTHFSLVSTIEASIQALSYPAVIAWRMSTLNSSKLELLPKRIRLSIHWTHTTTAPLIWKKIKGSTSNTKAVFSPQINSTYTTLVS